MEEPLKEQYFETSSGIISDVDMQTPKLLRGALNTSALFPFLPKNTAPADSTVRHNSPKNNASRANMNEIARRGNSLDPLHHSLHTATRVKGRICRMVLNVSDNEDDEDDNEDKHEPYTRILLVILLLTTRKHLELRTFGKHVRRCFLGTLLLQGNPALLYSRPALPCNPTASALDKERHVAGGQDASGDTASRYKRVG